MRKRPTGPRLSAGCVVVRARVLGSDPEFLFLLLRAYRNWDFPKGGVEPGEQPLAAAVRETAEETAIADLEFPWGQDWIETAPYSGGKTARYYLARTQTARVTLGVNTALGRPEHHEFRWVDLTEAFALVPPRVEPIVAWAAGKIAASAVLAGR
jgi:8-oxo-dGTP pyrophosphatase MutT (NUDIX family)